MSGFCANFSQAADPRYRFDSWTTDNGLPQVSVNSICQTRDGFIWMTTFGGLVRYDGLRFQVFNTGNTKGLRTSRFVRIEEDREGTLWISTEGQGITRYKDGSFTTYTTENGLPDNLIEFIGLGPSGDLILEAGGKDMRWNGDGFTEYSRELSQPRVRPLFRTKTGGVWYFEDAHLRKFENGKLVVDFPTDLDILRVFEDSAGRLWIAVNNENHLIMLQNGRITAYYASEGFPEFRLGPVLEDRDGVVWFGAGEELFSYDGRKFNRFTSADGLVRGGVNALLQDREGTLWVGTTGGLSKLTRRVITAYSTADGLAADNVYPIFEDRDGRIWIGSWTGLTIYENGVFQNVGARYSIGGGLITAILKDSRENLWIGMWSGLVMPEGANRAPRPPPNILALNIHSIYEDRIGNIWFGTSNGLIKFDGASYTAYSQKEGFPGRAAYVIHQDRSGRLLIGTDSGLVIYQDGRFISVSEKYGIAENIVRSIYEDSDGVVWVGMYDSGIYRFKDENFTHYTTGEGLFDDGAFKIIEDDAGNFWISCNLGIYRIKKAELNDLAEGRIKEVTSVLYNKRDGMLNSECNGGNQNAGLKARDGRIWFPTQQGVAVIDPLTVPSNDQPPPVVIESLIIDTRPVPVKASINLEPGQTNLELHYSGLSFINPELVKFKYKLEGLDNDWIDAGTRRTAYYPHLPVGEYRFVVLAANRDGVWNEQGATIAINVLPAFWQTWWFLILVTLGVLFLIFFIYRFRIGQLKKTHAAQEAFARQLIESQESERKRIAAELHDSLGQSLVLIKNWALLALGGLSPKDPAKPNLEEISSTASEAIREVREIAYNLGPYQLERLGLRNTIEEMVQKVADASPITFNTDIRDIEGCLEREAEISFFRIVQEALNNVVKHSGATEAIIKIRAHQNLLILMLRDNGNGFDTELAKTGFGLLGMQERVGLLRGELSVKSDIGKGTSVTVTLPCKNHNE